MADVKQSGPAEQQLGAAVYQRIEVLMDAHPDTPEAAEFDYLSHLAESVEEWGGYDGPLDPFVHQDVVAERDRLKARAEELEGALRQIAKTKQRALTNAPRPEDGIVFIGGYPQDIARAALQSTQQIEGGT